MKKKILSLITVLCMMIALLPINVITVSAYDGKRYGDYLYYTVSNGEATISYCEPSVTEIVIPTEIDGYPVTSIGHGAFNGCHSLDKVYITDLAKWCNMSFHGNPLNYAHKLYLNNNLITDLVIPKGVTQIPA